MKRASSSPEFRPLVALLLLLGAAFALACRLAESVDQEAMATDSVMARVLGGTRTIVGDRMYEMADLYFHQGVPHKHKRAFRDTFQKWSDEITPTGHVHTKGDVVHEIMPWLRFATKANPDNVEAYIVAAYWMADQGSRPDLAERILLEAQWFHPEDYRIYLEKGRVYLLQRDAVKAAGAFDAGIRLWPSEWSEEDETVRHEFAQMIGYRAFLCELEGDKEEALRLFEKSSAMFPENRSLKRRVAELRSGEIQDAWARDAWDSLFPVRQVCDREHDDDSSHVCGPSCDHDHDHEAEMHGHDQESEEHDHHDHEEH